MTFKLSTSRYFYTDNEMEKFKQLGFTFGRYEDTIFDDNAKNTIAGEPEISINSIEELIDFSDQWGKLIISNGNIEIYNDYRE